MEEKIKLDIDFYKPETEDTFIKVKMYLREIGCNEEGVNKILEELYYAVANEYGD